MARPFHSNSQQTRQRILEQAALLFAQNGINGTSVREIARSSKVNVAMVSHYFGGKQGLYKACISAMYEELSQGQTLFIDTLTKGESFQHIIEQTLRDAFAFACSHRNAIRLLMHDIVNRGEFDPVRREEFLLPFLDKISQILSSPQRNAQAIRLSLQSLIFVTARYAICTSEELALISGNSTDPHRAIADHLVQLAWGALGPQELS